MFLTYYGDLRNCVGGGGTEQKRFSPLPYCPLKLSSEILRRSRMRNNGHNSSRNRRLGLPLPCGKNLNFGVRENWVITAS